MKSKLTFRFVKTEDDAKNFCESIIKNQSSYMNKHHKPTYHFWKGTDGSQAYVIWYRQ